MPGRSSAAWRRCTARPGESTSSSTIGGGGPIEDVPVDWVKMLFETNYFGVVRVTQAVLPGMRERRRGAIVNISPFKRAMASTP
jgi:NADP-dependent 3-hydroxy acid dehydrogenase YdfG